MATKPQTVVQHRSAVSGQFVTPSFAKTHPRTTVTERNSKPAPTKSK